MTSAYIAALVRAVLTEYGLPDVLQRVAALPFSWEVTLRSPAGAERYLTIHDGGLETVTDAIRRALSPGV